MRCTALRLVACALAAGATLMVSAPAASAGPVHDAGRERPDAASGASLNSPKATDNLGRKWGT